MAEAFQTFDYLLRYRAREIRYRSKENPFAPVTVRYLTPDEWGVDG